MANKENSKPLKKIFFDNYRKIKIADGLIIEILILNIICILIFVFWKLMLLRNFRY